MKSKKKDKPYNPRKPKAKYKEQVDKKNLVKVSGYVSPETLRRFKAATSYEGHSISEVLHGFIMDYISNSPLFQLRIPGEKE